MDNLVAELRASAVPKTHVGDCMLRAADEIQELRRLLFPFSTAYEISKRSLGDMADVGHLDAVAKLYVRLSEMKQAADHLKERD